MKTHIQQPGKIHSEVKLAKVSGISTSPDAQAPCQEGRPMGTANLLGLKCKQFGGAL